MYTQYMWMEAIQILFCQLKTDGDSFEKIQLYNAFLYERERIGRENNPTFIASSWLSMP